MGFIGLICEVLVLTAVIAGIALNAAVVGSCEVIEVEGFRQRDDIVGFGPWKQDITDPGNCQTWDKDQVDAPWQVNMARACSMMALVFGLVLAVFVFFKQCLFALPCSQRMIDLCGLGVQVGLILTWPIWRADICDGASCSWGTGMTLLFCSQVCYACASLFSRCMREPRSERKKKEPKHEKKEKPVKQEEPVKEEKDEGSNEEVELDEA